MCLPDHCGGPAALAHWRHRVERQSPLASSSPRRGEHGGGGVGSAAAAVLALLTVGGRGGGIGGGAVGGAVQHHQGLAVACWEEGIRINIFLKIRKEYFLSMRSL